MNQDLSERLLDKSAEEARSNSSFEFPVTQSDKMRQEVPMLSSCAFIHD